jgi:HAD superfamily hydrolase (TIGR01484 family)
MIAYKNIKNEDYNLWRNKLYEDEIDIEKKYDLHDRLYNIIENDLILLGGTVVEDKLQDNVPQTIKELKSAGIKIWILTGDKLDTAESIGYNCNLLSNDQKIFILKIMNNEEETLVLNRSFKELNNFFKEFQEFIISLVKKYNSESQYLNNNWIYNNSNIRKYNIEITQDNNKTELNKQSNTSFNFSSINFELFNYIIENDILEPFSIIIESPVLNLLFKDEEMTKDFVKIAYYSNTVICCRISPSQKSQIIQKIKKFDKNAITLAIGDGSNDVSMITEANIGIGIYGEEGMSAVQACDFAIGEFQLLKRLLFIHGRSNLYRISKMIIYFFYKNFIFSFCQFYYSTRCLASGQSIIDEWYVTFYNLIFTSIPLCIRALTDTDIDLNNEKQNLALLYKENRDKNKIFTFKKLILNFLKGIFFSLIFYLSGFDNEILIHGYNKNMSYVSLRIYISIIIVVSMNLLIQSHFIVCLLPLSIGITTFLLLIIFLILNHYGIFFNCNSKASLIIPIISSQFILVILYIACINFVFEYSSKIFRIYFNNSLSSELLLNKKSPNKNEINNIYQYSSNKISIIPKEKLKEDKSNISFISKKSSLNKLNLINQNKKKYFHA